MVPSTSQNQWPRNIASAMVVALLAGGMPAPTATAIATETPALPFVYRFDTTDVLEESNTLANSTSPYFWLNSGAYLRIADGVGMTVQRDLSAEDGWRARYAAADPGESDLGAHPQNIFRLFTRSEWGDVAQSVDFRIERLQYSASRYRAASNGVLLINRMADHDNLYYAGIRVDGLAVIKKKRGGEYATLAQARVFEGAYDRVTRPNLLPVDEWMGLRTETRNLPDGSVSIKLFVDRHLGQGWTLVAEAVDDGSDGRPVLLADGHAGIRTDFMDVTFDDYRIEAVP